MSLEEESPSTSAPAAEPEPEPEPAPTPRVPEIPAWAIPSVEHLIVSDGEPVEGSYFEKLMRLLVGVLYASWSGPGEGRNWVAFSNVGIFPEPKQTPIVPDVLVSLDVSVKLDRNRKETQSYFVWVMGKPPDVAIELVSDKRGDEATYKMRRYAQIGVAYYAIFDPYNHLKSGLLRVFELRGREYHPIDPKWLPAVGLGLTLWKGEFEDLHDENWLRWCDRDGNVIPTPQERAAQAEGRAAQAEGRAEKAEGRAEKAERRAERLAEKLRALGLDPTTLNGP